MDRRLPTDRPRWTTDWIFWVLTILDLLADRMRLAEMMSEYDP
jgi:hypothetical protein